MENMKKSRRGKTSALLMIRTLCRCRRGGGGGGREGIRGVFNRFQNFDSGRC
jgi:hypothetical protein